MATRKIVQIDEAKCNGCGECVPSCAEGAIKIVGGKAKLVADVYCDGLGACLGHCPMGAITVIEREAEAFDEQAVHQNLARQKARTAPHPAMSGCPGAAVRSLQLNMAPARPMNGHRPPQIKPGEKNADGSSPALVNWPIQLHLVPPTAPFLRDADVVLGADCAAFATPDFHTQVLQGRPLMIGCPKLDDGQFYVEKLADIITIAGLRSITVVRMEVPCCSGLMRIAQAAKALSGIDVEVNEVVVSIRGQLIG
jgi:Fe-S-cluster-containing hydrogenase component 2